MPKNRRRNNQNGAKSISIRTKNKIGGRKSNRGAAQMTASDLMNVIKNGRPRDRAKARYEMWKRLQLVRDELAAAA